MDPSSICTSAGFLRPNDTRVSLRCRRGIALAALGGPIYAIGGLDDNSCFNDVERYDIESDRWSAVAPMNTPRGGVGSVALGVRLGRRDRESALGLTVTML